MLKILITGVNGFVGQHLLRELKSRGHGVVGLGHEHQASQAVLDLADRYETCDLTDNSQVAALDLTDYDAIINLAGLAKTGDSFGADELYRKVNVEVLEILGEILAEQNSKSRLIAVSTGAVYASDQPMPLTEKSKTISHGSPYAMSKLAMEKSAEKLVGLGLGLVIVRPFNHSGPGQAPGFLIPDLYQKLMSADETDGVIKTGNLAARRDFTDVRDIVRAYADLAEAKVLNHSVYNICSGQSRSGQEILDIMLNELGLTDKVRITTDPDLLRPDDPAELYGDYSRLHKDTGWQPAIAFEKTIRDFISSIPADRYHAKPSV